jgi:hypothetical protein
MQIDRLDKAAIAVGKEQPEGIAPLSAGREALLSLARAMRPERPNRVLRKRDSPTRLCRLHLGQLETAFDSLQRSHNAEPTGFEVDI